MNFWDVSEMTSFGFESQQSVILTGVRQEELNISPVPFPALLMISVYVPERQITGFWGGGDHIR